MQFIRYFFREVDVMSYWGGHSYVLHESRGTLQCGEF